MMTDPAGLRLSIITVTEDMSGADFQRTSASLRDSQPDPCIEWLIVPAKAADTAPPDATVLPPCDSGIYEAMNAGLEAAQAPYVWFLNGGDALASPAVLATIMDALTEKSDLLYGDALELEADGSQWRKPARPHQTVVKGMFTHHQAMIYRRALCPNLRFNSHYRIAADYAFTIGFIKQAVSIRYLPEPFCRFAAGGRAQQAALQGQREQDKIRRELLATNALERSSIQMRQTLSRWLRRLAPALWRALRQGEQRHP
jgi:putative colanic acid biosynthesis glycosyltransferase